MKRLIYTLIMTTLSPLGIIGFMFYIIPVLFTKKKVAVTSYEALNWRILYHLDGTRFDPAAEQLGLGLPATNWFFQTLVIKITLWACRVSGHLPVYVEYPPPEPVSLKALIGARCEFHDKVMLDHIMAGDQVVILGAGWDTRAYGMLKDKNVKIFEVDTPGTQAAKRAAIEKTGIDASHVTFVSCDLNRENWLDAVGAQGFDPSKRTYILWEAVTMYIEEHAVRNTLQQIATLPSGSAVSFEVSNSAWLTTATLGKVNSKVFKAFYNAPFTYAVPVTSDVSGYMSEYLKEYQLVSKEVRALTEPGDEIPYAVMTLAVKP